MDRTTPRYFGYLEAAPRHSWNNHRRPRALYARRFLSRRVHSGAPLINGETHTRPPTTLKRKQGCDSYRLVPRRRIMYLEKHHRFLGVTTKDKRGVVTDPPRDVPSFAKFDRISGNFACDRYSHGKKKFM